MSRSRHLSYLIALLSVAITFLISFLVRDLFKEALLLVFVPAIAFSALYGGLGPGIVATSLSTLAVTYYLTPATDPSTFDWSIPLRIGLFAAVALIISWLQEARHKVEREATDQAFRSAATLASIGEAVIATDATGHVTVLNPVAEKLTGWKESEARGVEISRVLTLLNQETAQPETDPVSRILREGKVT